MTQTQPKVEGSDRFQQFSIELDCPPGQPRPGDLLPSVLEDTGLEVDDFELVSTSFGNWTWVLKAEVNKDKLYEEHRHKTIKPRVHALFGSNLIRYGSW